MDEWTGKERWKVDRGKDKTHTNRERGGVREQIYFKAGESIMHEKLAKRNKRKKRQKRERFFSLKLQIPYDQRDSSFYFLSFFPFQTFNTPNMSPSFPALSFFLRRGDTTTSPQLFGTGANCFLPADDDCEAVSFTVAGPCSCTIVVVVVVAVAVRAIVSSPAIGVRISLLGTREEPAESLLGKVARGCR